MKLIAEKQIWNQENEKEEPKIVSTCVINEKINFLDREQ